MNQSKTAKLGSEKKAALYVRVSTRYQVDKDSLPFQRKKLKEYCNFLDIKKYIIFEDDGYSAKNTERPQFQEMMARIRAGEFSHLIVWKVDRISRNLLDFSSMYQELKNYRVTFISMNEQFDTSTAIGEAMLKIILVFAELERNMTSERVTSIMLDRAEQGLWNGARMPVGFQWNSETKFPEPDPKEAKIVRLIYDKYEEWTSCTKIARYLNTNNIKGKRGGQWTSKLIRDIIRNPFYIGTYRYNMRESGRGRKKPESEWIIRENNHPGIISKQQFDKCNQIMDKNRKSHDTSDMRERKFVHIFSGRLICGSCGASMIASKDRARANGWQPSMYRCSHRYMLNCDNARVLNEASIGTFVFNYIANLIKVQKKFKKLKNCEEMEKELLKGNAFDRVTGISQNDLEETFRILSSRQVERGTYTPNLSSGLLEKSENFEQIEILKAEIEKNKAVIAKLMDIYLYDEESMTKEEFMTRKRELVTKTKVLEKKIAKLMDKPESDTTDITFIKKASAFLVTQNLLSTAAIDYINMAMTVDGEILKDFIEQMVDRIVITDGRIQSITFVNGLKHTFLYTSPAELPVCVKCGGRIGTTCGCRARTFSFDQKRYRRICVGDERDRLHLKESHTCPECRAESGRWHHWGCKMEICPVCGNILTKCEHGQGNKTD